MLELDENNIGPRGAAALSKQNNLAFRLDNNHIGDEGAVALSKNKNLKCFF